MKTKKQLEKKYNELKRDAKWIKATWGIVMNYDVVEATLTQTNEIIEMIEGVQKKLGKSLIDNSKCKCLNLTDKYRGISDIFFSELLKKIKGDGI